MSRVLLVSSFPPRHCGIGAYAAAQAARWRAEGHEVAVISPPDGDGDVRVPFLGGRPFREAVRIGGRFDRIVVHFQPALYLAPRAPIAKAGAALGLWWLCVRRPRTEILVHEADVPRWWRPEERLLRWAFRAAPRLLFHTDRERRAFERAYRISARARIVAHADGVRAMAMDRTEARRRLGLPAGERILVAPGFIHPDKGLDRAIEAFHGPGTLYVVGSVKDQTPSNRAFAKRLRALAEAAPAVELVERYVDDEEFDAWVAAADAVVLAYRRSWSSGVLARAQALGTPAVVADVGGLGEQAGPADLVASDDHRLGRAMAEIGSRVAP